MWPLFARLVDRLRSWLISVIPLDGLTGAGNNKQLSFAESFISTFIIFMHSSVLVFSLASSLRILKILPTILGMPGGAFFLD